MKLGNLFIKNRNKGKKGRIDERNIADPRKIDPHINDKSIDPRPLPGHDKNK